jgi:hypothetical protein
MCSSKGRDNVNTSTVGDKQKFVTKKGWKEMRNKCEITSTEKLIFYYREMSKIKNTITKK